MKWNVREDPNLYRKIKLLDIDSLKRMAEEIRQYIIEVVSQKEGHLASNLGAVELTLALYKVFDLDKDLFVWDVSHQCYTHKILTGRAREFKTIRDLNGLSGFTSRKESRFDVFGAGHASTSIAAGYGFATARDLLKETNKIIMVIGDGALAGGMALEALNQ
ncbi:MAG: 1-deoxy-D-xylulose-5-phosphate synthase, partial [Thermotoga sp.]